MKNLYPIQKVPAVIWETTSDDEFLEIYERINKRVKYRLVRYGNVLYSSGSVLCLWKDKLLNGEEIIPEFGNIGFMDLSKHNINHGVTKVIDGPGRYAILDFPKLKTII